MRNLFDYIKTVILRKLEFWGILMNPGLGHLLFFWYEMSPRGIVFYSTKTLRIIHANPFFLAKTGYSMSELRDKPIEHFLYPEKENVYDTTKEIALVSYTDWEGIRVFTNVWRSKDGQDITMKWISVKYKSFFVSEVDIYD